MHLKRKDVVSSARRWSMVLLRKIAQNSSSIFLIEKSEKTNPKGRRSLPRTNERGEEDYRESIEDNEGTDSSMIESFHSFELRHPRKVLYGFGLAGKRASDYPEDDQRGTEIRPTDRWDCFQRHSSSHSCWSLASSSSLFWVQRYSWVQTPSSLSLATREELLRMDKCELTSGTIGRDGGWTTVGQECIGVIHFGERIGSGKATGLFQDDIQLAAVGYFFEIHRPIGFIEERLEKDDVLPIDIQPLAWTTAEERT